MFHKVTCFLILYSKISLSESLDPYNDGPYPPEHRLYLATFNNGLDHQVDVWAPDAPGKFPVIYMMGGMGAIFPGALYVDMFTHLASHGVVIVEAWSLTNPANHYKSEWFLNVHNWVVDHMEDKLHSSGLDRGLELDLDNKILMGHSSGAHVVVEFLKHHCDMFKGQILFSPVDGVDPFGLIDDFAITPGQYVNYALPTLVLMAGLDGLPGGLAGSLTPACVPEGLGNMRFYEAMPSNTWLVNATKYGHGDIINEFYYEGLVATQFCGTDQTQDRVLYRQFASGQLWSFLSAVLFQECEYLQYIEDPNLMTVETVTLSKPGILSTWKCGEEPKCVWNAAHIIE